MRCNALIAGLAFAVSACSTTHERYVVVDCDARQIGTDELRGALFSFDRDTKRVDILCTDKRFMDPQDVVVDHDGSLLVVDMSAQIDEHGGNGAVFRVDPTTGSVVDVYSSPDWVHPTSLALGVASHVLYVVDRGGSGAESTHGRLHALDLTTGVSTVAVTSPDFIAPSAAIAEPDGRLIVLDADAPSTASPEQGILFAVDGVGTAPRELMRLHDAVSPLGFVQEPSGSFLVLDCNADPRKLGGPLGAIFRADPLTGTTTLLASPEVFRDPFRGCWTDDGLLLFADANADPEHRGPDPAGRGQNITGPGALFLLDPRTNAVTLAATSDRFVNPVAVARLP